MPGIRSASIVRKGRIRIAVAACIVLAIAASGAVGCANSEAKDPTPVKTFKITPAAEPRTVVAGASPTANASPAPGASAAAGGAVTIVGQNTQFQTTSVTATAGAVTIHFDNRDSGVVHNLHVFQGANAQGTSVGQTAFAPGPVQQDLQVNVSAGSYFFQCDAHPTTMKGTITVQ